MGLNIILLFRGSRPVIYLRSFEKKCSAFRRRFPGLRCTSFCAHCKFWQREKLLMGSKESKNSPAQNTSSNLGRNTPPSSCSKTVVFSLLFTWQFTPMKYYLSVSEETKMKSPICSVFGLLIFYGRKPLGKTAKVHQQPRAGSVRGKMGTAMSELR